MKSKLLLLGLAFVAGITLAAVGAGPFARPYTFHGSVIESPASAADFTLTDQSGQPFRLSDQSGKVVLLFFGYTHCTDVCPATLTQFKQVRAQLGAEADQVRFVLITVDPERDTAGQLRDYLAGFDPSFIGLTGAGADLAPVWRSYGVFREPYGVEVDHTARIYAVDRKGNLRVTYAADTATDDLAQDVRQLLKSN